jgi:hypothetical protein
MKRRWLLCAAVCFSVGLIGVGWRMLELWPFHNAARSGFQGISPGTPRAEVYRILGGPGWRPDCGVGVPPGEEPEFWERPNGTVRVDFDESGHVIRAQGPNP